MIWVFCTGLRCTSCGRAYPLEPLYECFDCGGILDVSYDYEKIKQLYGASVSNFHLLPFVEKEKITLGEGKTPLLELKRLGKRIGIDRLFGKCEFCNPTGSFKDRPVSVGISMAVKFGYSRVIVASSGNGAASVSAFAARAGLEAVVLVPESAPNEKVKQALFYGAKVIRVKGPYSNCFAMAKEIAVKDRIFNLTSTFINPYTVEGDKFVAFELFEQLEGEIPDIVSVPIGAGPLLVGIYKGYEEYVRIGKASKLPRMAGIQAEGCSPIAQAFLSGAFEVHSDPNPKTIAGGICDGLHGYAKDGTRTLKVIRQSKGFSDYVTDEEIRTAQYWLAKDEGIFVEPSAAASIAGLAKGIRTGKLSSNALAVAVLTGHGLKDMKSIECDDAVPTISHKLERLLILLDNR